MKNGLPQGWTTAPLNSLCEKLRGVSYKRDEASPTPRDGYLPILRANNIDADRLTFNELVWVPASRISDQQKLRKGDVVVAMSSGSKSIVGKTAQAPEDWKGAFGAFCGVLRPSPKIDSQYLGLFLRTREYRAKISDLAAGSNINNLKNKHFAEIEVPFPPLPEQRRIVAKLEGLLAKVNVCQQRLANVPVLLKRFRQSVLAADWREKNPGMEPVQRLGKGKPPEEIQLPASWDWWLSEHIFNFVTSGSRGWAKYYSSIGALFIRVGNLEHGSIKLDLRDVQHARPPQSAEGRRTRVQMGDILISITADVGMIALVDQDMGEAYINQHVALARPSGNLDSRFLALFLSAENGGQKQFLGMQRGATKIGLGLDDIRSVWVACPPLAEQREIVRRVESLFALADQIETRCARAKGHADTLTQSILAKAFRGELVHTDLSPVS